jgi:hypothetical protein
MIASHPARSSPADARPYPPSWLDRLIGAIGRLPVPAPAFYLAASAIAILFVNAEGWIGGLVPPGTFDRTQSSYAFFLIYPIALVHYLDGAAHHAWRGFRPALDVDDETAARMEYELTTVPARPALAWAATGIILNNVSYVSDPVSMQMAGLPLATVVLRAVSESFLSAVVLVFVYELYRQLRMVSRLTSQATRIDLFQPGPLYAFSHLTVRAGIGITLMAAWQLVTSPPELNATWVSVGWIAAAIVAGAAAFVLPLLGMHTRIAEEKDRLVTAAGRRLTAAIDRLHAVADAHDLSQADALDKLLSSLTRERELLARLPTWPWQTGTIWAFASAVGLPLGLWLVTRLLEKVV